MHGVSVQAGGSGLLVRYEFVSVYADVLSGVCDSFGVEAVLGWYVVCYWSVFLGRP